MAIEITEGVYKFFIPIPNNPLEKTNVYFLKDGKDNILIDTGWNNPVAWHSLEKELQHAGSCARDVTNIVVTHIHPDHYCLVSQLKKVSGATVYIHREEANNLHKRYVVSEKVVREGTDWFVVNGIPREEMPIHKFPYEKYGRGEITEPDILLEDNQQISVGKFKIKVIWTPGHSTGHVCLYDADRKLLFSGDHVLPVITPNIGLESERKNNPLGDFIKSLLKIRDLPVDTVLPAHERRFYNLAKRVDEIIRHHEHRNQEILAALKSGHQTAYQVSQHITWMPEQGGMKFYELMTWSRVSAVSETLAHLRAMTVEGKLKTFIKEGIIYYALV
jgi:glyoxylase-like metal-dependent hydrolase (beta-lactamase superfamily II)